MARHFKKINLRHGKEKANSMEGEDGDFVQLRIIREKRQLDICTSGEQPKKRKQGNNTLERILGTPKQTKTIVKRDDPFKLQKKLFKLVDDKNLDKFLSTITKHKDEIDLETIVDPKTGMNILHHALEIDAMEIASHLIEESNVHLVTASYTFQRSGLEGCRNAIHILIQKGNQEMIAKVLNKVGDVDHQKELLSMETAVEMAGQRPKLLPCLHLAAFLGNISLVESLLDNTRMDIDSLNSKHETALMWASRIGHLEMVGTLLQKGADANIESGKGSTALYWAVRYNHAEITKILIKDGKANPNHRRKYGLVSPLILACTYGYEELVDVLLGEKSVDVNTSIRGGETALHYATREGHNKIINMLMEKGSNIDCPDEFGDTPLLIAVKYGHVNIASMFIDKGAAVERRNREGHDIWEYAMDKESNTMLETLVIATQEMTDLTRIPLCVAAEVGKTDKVEFVEFLIQMGVDIQATDKDGNTFIHYAAMKNNFETIKRFCSPDLLEIQNQQGNTAFHIACYRGFGSSINAFIELKAKMGIKNNKGETVLHSAAYCKRITADTVGNLVDYTIKNFSWDILNSKDYQGNNCLHIAAKHATPEVIWQFRKVSIKEQDKDGMTPLHEAVRPNEPEALDIILDIFELARRDARINEQTFVTRETVLNFAAQACNIDGVKRLIQLGADISERDYNGDTVLHRIVITCVQDAENKLQHLQVFDAILDNIVTWWCIKNNLSVPHENDTEQRMAYRQEAVVNMVHTQLNKDSLSVCDLAFAVGCFDFLSRLLVMKDVTHVLTEDTGTCNHVFDITGVIPRTNSPLKSKEEKARERENLIRGAGKCSKKISGIEWLVASKDTLNTGRILDIPPIQIIEKHYMSLVGTIFTTLLVLHVIYMSVLTYVGIDMQQTIRTSNFTTFLENVTRSDKAALYFLVPLEPVIIIVGMLLTFLRNFFSCDMRKRIKIRRTQTFTRSLSLMQSCTLPLIYTLFAVSVLAWIALIREGYAYQDYVLAFAVCLGWLISITLTRGIRMVHYFCKMLISIISRDVVRFLFVYSFVLMAVSSGLHVLFQISNEIVKQYPNTGTTIFRTFNLMTGMDQVLNENLEEGMNSVGRTIHFFQAFHLLYVILSTVIMLNVLIAMMNDSYSDVLREEANDWRIESIKLGLELESNMPLCRIFSPVSMTYGPFGHRSVKRWYVTLSEGDMEEYFQELERKAYKPDAVTHRLETIEQRTRAIEKSMNQKFQQITDVLETKKKKKAWFKSQKEPKREGVSVKRDV